VDRDAADRAGDLLICRLLVGTWGLLAALCVAQALVLVLEWLSRHLFARRPDVGRAPTRHALVRAPRRNGIMKTVGGYVQLFGAIIVLIAMGEIPAIQ
jgi:hypothetical protein